MIAVAQWLNIWVFTMEVPGSNSGNFFSTFSCIFYPTVTVLLEYLDPTIYSCSFFCFVIL